MHFPPVQVQTVQVQNRPLGTIPAPPPISPKQLADALKAKLVATFGSSLEVLLANVKTQKSWYDLARVILPEPKPAEFPVIPEAYKPLMARILQAALDVNLDDPEVGDRLKAEIASLLGSGSVAPIRPPLSPLISSFSVAAPSLLPSLPPPPPYSPSPPLEFTVPPPPPLPFEFTVPPPPLECTDPPPPPYTSLVLVPTAETRPVPTPRQRVQREYNATKFMCGLSPQDVGRFGVLLTTPAPFALIISDLISYDLMENAVQGISLVIKMARSNPTLSFSAVTITSFVQALTHSNNPQLLGRQTVLAELNRLLIGPLSGSVYSYGSLPQITAGIPPMQMNPLDRIDFLITHMLLGIRGGIMPLADGTFQPTDFPFLFAPRGLVIGSGGILTAALSDHVPFYRQNTPVGDCFSWHIGESFAVSPVFSNNGFAVAESPEVTLNRMGQIHRYLCDLTARNANLNVISLQAAASFPITMPDPSNSSRQVWNLTFMIPGFSQIQLSDGKLIFMRDSAVELIPFDPPFRDFPGGISSILLRNRATDNVCQFLTAHIPLVETKAQDPVAAAETTASFIQRAIQSDFLTPAVFMGNTNEEIALLRQHLPSLTVEGHPLFSAQTVYYQGQPLNPPNPFIGSLVNEEARAAAEGRPELQPISLAFGKIWYPVINNVDVCIVYDPGADRVL